MNAVAQPAAQAPKLTPSQTRAVAQFRAFMERQLNTNPAYGDRVDSFEVTTTDYGSVWVAATTDMAKLDECSVLRVIARQNWHVQIGKGGRITVFSSPKSFHQFHGRRAFGMVFRKP